MKDPSAVGRTIFLKELQVQDVTDAYADWMNDPSIYRYLESRSGDHTLSSIKSFVEAMADSSDNVLFGIFLDGGKPKHIGNIKIGDIDGTHHNAHIGFLIGDRGEWGHGYATKAIQLATSHAFDKLGLNKVWAGAYSSNTGSRKALLKAGWSEVGKLTRHVLLDGVWEDKLFFEKLNPNFSSI